MSWFKRKQEYYNEGYRQGSTYDLGGLGHSPETLAQYLEEECRKDILDPRFCDDEREFFYGLIDGSSDRARRQ